MEGKSTETGYRTVGKRYREARASWEKGLRSTFEVDSYSREIGGEDGQEDYRAFLWEN